MSLKTIRDRLRKLPESKHLIVDDFPRHSLHKIGYEPENQFITLLVYSENKTNLVYNPVGGKHLSISYDISCTIQSKNNKIEKNKNYTIITLKTKEQDIEDYFIELCLIFVKRVGSNPNLAEVKLQYEKLESIFIRLSKTSSNSIVGLWGELFLIAISKAPAYLINSWHKEQNDKFDFNDGIDKLEVKTTTQNRRVHNFEIRQLKVFGNSLTVIASVITAEIDNGKSIKDLIDLIKVKVNSDIFEKLVLKTFDVIGDNINESSGSRFDFKMAQSQTKLYFSEDIPKPGLIPKNILEVKFQVDLEGVNNIIKSKYKGKLLSSLK
jgi:hypothetical protein